MSVSCGKRGRTAEATCWVELQEKPTSTGITQIMTNYLDGSVQILHSLFFSLSLSIRRRIEKVISSLPNKNTRLFLVLMKADIIFTRSRVNLDLVIISTMLFATTISRYYQRVNHLKCQHWQLNYLNLFAKKSHECFILSQDLTIFCTVRTNGGRECESSH